MTAISISIMNAKGGVGKTTTAVNLAAGLANRGRKVLLVDLDAQGSASTHLGINIAAASSPESAFALLWGHAVHPRPLPEVDGLSLLVGTPDLAKTDIMIGGEVARERFLARALKAQVANYDYIIVDCPPALSLLTVNALVGCDWYLVPVPPKQLDLEGLGALWSAHEKIQDGIGQVARLFGILPTMVDYRVNITTATLAEMQDVLGDKLLRLPEGLLYIPINNRLAEAPSYGQDIFRYDRACPGAKAYVFLAELVEAKTAKKNAGMKEFQQAGKA